MSHCVNFLAVAVLASATLIGCANPSGGSSSSTVAVKVLNNTGAAITLQGGDFAAYRAGSYLAPYQVSVPSGSLGTTFTVPAGSPINLWYLDSAGLPLAYLVSSGDTARSFTFLTNLTYTLTLNKGNYTLSDGSSAYVPPQSNGDVVTRVFPVVTRSDAVAGVTESVHAAPLTAKSGTILYRRTSTSKVYTFLAEVAYGATAGTKTISFPKARLDFLDAAGQVLYSTTQGASSDGTYYLTVDGVSRYYSSSSSAYVYGTYDLFPGGTAYLTWTVYLYDSDAEDVANVLYGLDVNKVQTMNLALTASDFTSLANAPVPASLALAPSAEPTMTNTLWQRTYANPATSTVWWKVNSYSKVMFRDADQRLIDSAYLELGTGGNWLVAPGGSSVYQAKVPASSQGLATAAVALVDYDEDVPVGSSVRGSMGVLRADPSDQEAAYQSKVKALEEARKSLSR